MTVNMTIMLSKDVLKNKFSKEWKKHYEVELFLNKGFSRKTCPKCKKNFWTLDQNREVCADSSCQNYDFIGKPIVKKNWDYVQTWKEFENFFKKKGHKSVQRYPVIDRWRPDLFFTIASIQDFQRIDNGKLTFEYPADPLIVPQVCLRFNDIQNVGVTGRHHTSFTMPGQHSFGNYWKDKTIELNFEFLNKVMGIPENQLIYIEDLWSMPDFSGFGPSLETVSLGLELVNSVFQQFTAQGSSYKELPKKVVDVGWGLERLAWFSNGTISGYDIVFDPVIKFLKKETGFKETDLFQKYALYSGSLDFEETDVRKTREAIAEQLGVTVNDLRKAIDPMHALYAIADHTKTLLFSITDGGIPSNVGGGYNLRIILRRMLSFMKDFSFTFDLEKIVELHARQLKPIYPELKEGLENFSKILNLEGKRYETTLEKAELLIKKELEKGGLDNQTLIKLYTSNGITPELIEKAAKKQNLEFKTPRDFYEKLTSAHLIGEKEEKGKKKIHTDTRGVPETELLYYENPYKTEFTATVVKKDGDWVVLDKTYFYPEGGGQPEDHGVIEIDGKKLDVIDVQIIDGVVFHKIKKAYSIKPGQKIHGIVDRERRSLLRKMHDATHIVAGSARKILGNHIWQAGAQKGIQSSRIDLTHYQPFTIEEIEKIEDLANNIVSKKLSITSEFLSRNDAECRYGFILYQGGASPGETVRVINTGKGFDVEACGGIHGTNTEEVEMIKIVRTERIQDGINRLEYVAGPVAKEFIKEEKETLKKVFEKVNSLSKDFLNINEKIKKQILEKKHNFISRQLSEGASILSVDKRQILTTVEKFLKEINQNQDTINKIRVKSGKDKRFIYDEDFFKENLHKIETFPDLCSFIFNLWKQQNKQIETMRRDISGSEARGLIEKARNNEILEIMDGDRKDLIHTASSILRINSELTVILVNQAGDVVGMSKTKDIGKIIRDICEEAGGSGGGKGELAQGRAELSKLLKIIEKRKG